MSIMLEPIGLMDFFNRILSLLLPPLQATTASHPAMGLDTIFDLNRQKNGNLRIIKFIFFSFQKNFVT